MRENKGYEDHGLMPQASRMRRSSYEGVVAVMQLA